MKLKELIELLEVIEFESDCPTFSLGNKLVEIEKKTFTMKAVGHSSTGFIVRGSFKIKRGYKIIKEYSTFGELLEDKEVLEMEFLYIPKILINQYYNRSSNGGDYYWNTSEFIIEVR